MFALSYFALGGWISCSNRAVTLLLWKGIVARLKRSNLYPTGLFCCSYIFFQSSHCSSSESTKPHTLDANTKVTCSWLCSLSKIIIENILVDPQQLTSALKIIYRSYLLWLGSKDTGVLFYRSWEGLEKRKDPQQWRKLSRCLSLVTELSCQKTSGSPGQERTSPRLEGAFNNLRGKMHELQVGEDLSMSVRCHHLPMWVKPLLLAQLYSRVTKF